MLKLRREYLEKQISALAARVRMLKGEKLKFDDESRALYDAVAPTYSDSHFDEIIAQLEAKIPGKNRQSGSDHLVKTRAYQDRHQVSGQYQHQSGPEEPEEDSPSPPTTCEGRRKGRQRPRETQKAQELDNERPGRMRPAGGRRDSERNARESGEQ